MPTTILHLVRIRWCWTSIALRLGNAICVYIFHNCFEKVGMIPSFFLSLYAKFDHKCAFQWCRREVYPLLNDHRLALFLGNWTSSWPLLSWFSQTARRWLIADLFVTVEFWGQRGWAGHMSHESNTCRQYSWNGRPVAPDGHDRVSIDNGQQCAWMCLVDPVAAWCWPLAIISRPYSARRSLYYARFSAGAGQTVSAVLCSIVMLCNVITVLVQTECREFVKGCCTVKWCCQSM